MNLIDGNIADGVFSAEHVRISGLSAADGEITLGFRAEDASVARRPAEINAPVFTMELLGEATMLTVRAGGALASVKAAKDYRAEIGDLVSISAPAEICHLFDKETGNAIGSG